MVIQVRLFDSNDFVMWSSIERLGVEDRL